MKQANLIGLCGAARSGKDSFFAYSRETLELDGVIAKRFAFADALKGECDEFLWSHTRISAFTSDEEEKDIVRPLLVAWGTNIRRRLDRNCWIKKIEPEVKSSINDSCLPIITDVRYPNEADWVHDLGGIVIHISRSGINPANKEEAENDPILKEKSDLKMHWRTLGKNSNAYKDTIYRTLKDINLPQRAYG
jgi:hypothetical protein